MKEVAKVDVEEMKKIVSEKIDENADRLIKLAHDIDNHPELGFKEVETSKIVKEFFSSLNFQYREGLAITGVKAKLKKDSKGPNIAIIGELDAIPCPESPRANPTTGAAHACGHNLQLTAMLGAAMGIKLANIEDELSGNVTFFAVPAEEFVEIEYREKLYKEGKIHFFGGKQELIYLGEFDDIDISMMMHSEKDSPEAKVAIRETSSGFLAKTIQYIGKVAHAAESPHEGINALNGAILGLMGVNALRETFVDEQHIRVHPIITKGGDSVNSVPSDVRIETYVRAKTMEALENTHLKVDRALKAGGDAVGADVVVKTIPGYLPLTCSRKLNSIFVDNARQFIPSEKIYDAGHFFASTDMGDVSHLMPVIHPFVGGVSGKLHGKEFKVEDPHGAFILPAKLFAMTVIDLLSYNANTAKEVISSFKPVLTKEEYINKMEDYYSF